MKKRSEGIKRIVLVLSVLSVIGWVSWIGIESKGFSKVHTVGWLLIAGGILIAYFIPQLICKITYWVIEGFKRDKETS
jgi:hypothetical protein